MTPLDKYLSDLSAGNIVEDDAQRLAVEKLDDLYRRLVSANNSGAGRGWLGKRLGKLAKSTREPEQGLYFWGGVGRGKTYLMDMFYECLPVERKLRAHFHRFMRGVHHSLTELQGTKNPLEKVADEIAGRAQIICFDEFFVSDITDAMILAGLFEALFARGVALVATSNIDPDNLYKDGLQRQRFLPAIALIKKYTEVLNIDGGTDYRLRTLTQAKLYHTPINSSTDDLLLEAFQKLAPTAVDCRVAASADTQLDVEGRSIPTRLLYDDVVWFDFRALCDGPRSQNDYIEIAREFHAVILSDIPVLDARSEDLVRRFILLVDEFYDHRIKLVISAHAPLAELYQGHQQSFEFQRTFSRLQEMQSVEYLSAAHRA